MSIRSYRQLSEMLARAGYKLSAPRANVSELSREGGPAIKVRVPVHSNLCNRTAKNLVSDYIHTYQRKTS